MVAVIGVGVLLGRFLDQTFETETPYFTAGCAIFFVCSGIYLGVRDLLKP